MRLLNHLLAALIALAAASPSPAAHAQEGYSQAELDQMLAPIALYPDPLLSQILLAATRPLEVVEAARWSRAHPELQGNDAVAAAGNEAWDPSVKSLVAFPQLLERMDENLEWTKALGHAFFVQEPVVMETIQQLRQRARAAGELVADERMRVIDDGQAIVLEPAAPEVIYVPYYDPWVVYGPWWWSAYPPVSWAPWPGYGVVRRPGARAGFWWGPGIGISAGLMYGRVDWSHRRVRMHRDYSRPAYIRRDSPAPVRVGPRAPATAPRAEPPRQPRAERAYSRRELRQDVNRPEAVRPAPAAAAPAPRAQPRPAPTYQPAFAAPVRSEPARVERAPRNDPARTEAHRIERAPQAAPTRAEPRHVQPAPTVNPARVEPPRAQPAARAEPPRRERASAPETREARDGAPRWGARP